MEEKIKYVALMDGCDEDVAPEIFKFKESELGKGCEIIEKAVHLWKHKANDTDDSYYGYDGLIDLIYEMLADNNILNYALKIDKKIYY